jgi:hypothetical protein
MCLLSVLPTMAQDLTGIWRGTFYNEYEYFFTGAKYRYEVQLKNTGRQVKGVTYSYQTTRFYGKASMIGVWSSGDGNLTIRENQMLDLKIQGGGEGCLMTCYLSYRREGNREFLEGTYTSVNMHNDTMSCGGGVVRLEKVPDTDFELEDFLKKGDREIAKGGVKPGQGDFLIKKTLPAQPKGAPPAANSKPPVAKTNPPVASRAKPAAPEPQPKPAVPPVVQQKEPPATAAVVTPKEETAKPVQPSPQPAPPPVLVNRQKELVETITTSSRVLEISFYDNGEIDGDTISVYDNNRLVVSRKGLSAEPITVRIELSDTNPEHEVVMVAENLGAIPPNTSLMIVKAGSKRYTVRLSSTEQKNAAVRFRYDPDAPK